MLYYHILRHNGNSVLSYLGPNADRDGGIVRVINTTTSERLILKGFDGCIQDLAFSYTDNAYLGCCDSKGNVYVYLIFNEENGSMQLVHIY